MRKLLDEKLARFEELECQLQDPVVLANPTRMAVVAREHGGLNRLVNKYRRFRQLNQQISETQELAHGKDAEMRELAELELPELKRQREELWSELLDLTI